VLHLWHGEHLHRSYYDRSVELASHEFGPARDLEKNAAGMWQWRGGGAALRAWGVAYFARRREDGGRAAKAEPR
jgi:hypothetical protein